MASLYVGDLHATTMAAAIFEKFSPIGIISTIRVCRERKTGVSLGYAYVNYEVMINAQKALDTLNNDKLAECSIRIMWLESYSSIKKSGPSNVFLKNLSNYIDAKLVHESLSVFGNISSCKVAHDESDESKGYGFVQFESEESANRCIERLNGQKIVDGRQVYVGRFISRKDRVKESAEINKRYTDVYIKNIEKYFNDQELYELFAQFGTIVSSKVMLNENCSSRGFGFVDFKKPDEAEKAVADLNGKNSPEGKSYCVGRAQKKTERRQGSERKYYEFKKERIHTNLFVKNLHFGIDDRRLRDEFSVFGTITSAKVMMINGRSKGIGFVCFSSAKEANKAMASMNGRVISERPLYVSIAERKDDRLSYLRSNFQRYNNTIDPITTAGSSTVDQTPIAYRSGRFDFARRYGNPRIVSPQAAPGGFQPIAEEEFPTYDTLCSSDINHITFRG